jgi:TRAP-type C4-dicarboxylate transport system permease small subunit
MKSFTSMLDRIISTGAGISVVLIMLLILLSIVARWLDLTLLWVEPLARHLVFLSAFLGATTAVATNKHIRIDLLQNVLIEKLKNPMAQNLFYRFIQLVSMVILFFLIKSGYTFYLNEKEYPGEAFLGLHNYHLAFIIPAGMSLLFFRYCLTFFEEKK